MLRSRGRARATRIERGWGGGGPTAPLSGSVRRGAAAPGGAHHRCCAMGPHAITVQVLPRHSSRRRDSAAWRSTPRCRSRATATKIERGCGAAGVPSRVAVRSRAVALYAAAPAIRALCNGPSRNSRAGPSGHSLRRWDTATGRASLETGRGQRPRRCPVPHGRCSAPWGMCAVAASRYSVTQYSVSSEGIRHGGAVLRPGGRRLEAG